MSHDTEKDELKPCPFCGKTDELVYESLGDDDDWFIECDRCNAGTHAIHTKAAVVLMWNTRTPQDELDANGGWISVKDKLPEMGDGDLPASRDNSGG